MKHFQSLIILSVLYGSLFFSPLNAFDRDDYVYRDTIYQEGIETVVFYRKPTVRSLPVVNLNSNEQLSLSFDEMSSDYKNYRYTILHCDRNWKASRNLFRSEFIDGMFEDYIQNVQHSFNTYVPFTNYNLTFPSEYMRPKISGNYALIVYKDDISEPVLIRRFHVVEHMVNINGEAKPARFARNRETKQTLDFEVSFSSETAISNPARELSVYIRQNGRWDNMLKDVSPQYTTSDKLTYDYDGDLSFDAGNEYRQFDLRSVRTARMNVRRLFTDSMHHALLYTDISRSGRPYRSYVDFNGYRVIDLRDGSNEVTESDYVLTHFSLDYPRELQDGDVYIFGQLSDWQFKEAYRMKYDPIERMYVASIPLKQGFYNYKYVFVGENKQLVDFNYFENSHYQTENDYFVFVYMNRIADQYDRLVGYRSFNTKERE